MLDKLFSVFGGKAIHRVSMLCTISSQIVTAFEKEFQEDKDAKNAAIDAMIDILQKHKDVQTSPTT